jgi:phosphoribosyl-ATP pyrophosphohydrolase/phosphoribosyl-AMP cyclohydrolase
MTSTPQPVPLSLEGLDSIDFGESGLIPAVVQDRHTAEVLMVGFTNREMLAKTLETGDAWFWSRSRQQAWHKGATSGNYLRVREVRRNCEDNSLLLLVEPVGPACHTGARTCYYRRLDGTPVTSSEFRVPGSELEVDSERGTANAELPAQVGGLDWLFALVRERQQERPPGSYVVKLLDEGVDRIGRKIGEEAAEVIIAAKNRAPAELAGELADLWFHSLLLLADARLAPADVYRVLAQRHREKMAARDAT